MSARVLIVDDESSFRVLAEQALVQEGFEVVTAPSLGRALAEMKRSAPDVILLDRRLPDGDGIDFLRGREHDDGAAPLVIVVTAYGEVENAVEALRAGAVDYLTKPVQLTDLVVKLRKVLEARALKDRLHLARGGHGRPRRVDLPSRSMQAVTQELRRLAESPWTPALITGPSGCGKQYAAEALHEMTLQGRDEDAPFVEINCAALPEHLLESELFGHEKGAFTDARAARRGLIELASGGTLFLDEISELPLAAQAKLLKFLDTLRFRRVGGEREISVQLRIIAAANVNLPAQVEAGRFRADLYHRLAVFLIAIAPLAERTDDIPVLAESFARHFAASIKKRLEGLTPGAQRKLTGYPFPGNVRELRNVLERAVILAREPLIGEEDVVLPSVTVSAGPNRAAFFSVDAASSGELPPLAEVEARYVERVLEHHAGQRMLAAKALGISYPTFLKRLRELGLDRS